MNFSIFVQLSDTALPGILQGIWQLMKMNATSIPFSPRRVRCKRASLCRGAVAMLEACSNMGRNNDNKSHHPRDFRFYSRWKK